MNIAVVQGPCSVAPEVRLLQSGQHLISLAIRAEGTGEHATSVPVAVFDPPAWLGTLIEGEDVIVEGRVVRRFFRTNGATASRVELVADSIARVKDRRKSGALVRKLRIRFEAAFDDQ
jgi:hypothetical protein